MRKPTWITVAASRLTWVVLAVALVPLPSLVSAQDPQFFSDWSAPVNLGPPVNTALAEIAPFISKDELSLYFVRTAEAGGFGGEDIWVSQRASITDLWGPPQNLGPTINTTFNEFGPSLTLDGHTLFFASNRPGFGGNDLYISRRHNKRDDFGWQPAVNLGSPINTAANELAPAHFEDDVTGVITLYFPSNRPGGPGEDDIYVSTLLADETLGQPALVEELSTAFADLQPAIRRDGLEMFLGSPRPGVGIDLWVSTRASTSDPWSTPVNLGPVVNSTFRDSRPALSFDATELYFESNRPGGAGNRDLYRITRSKL
jgi:WD40-like Beta Propeller Repeat